MLSSRSQTQHIAITRFEIQDLDFELTKLCAVHIGQRGCGGQCHTALRSRIKRLGAEVGARAQCQHGFVVYRGDVDGVVLRDTQCATQTSRTIVIDRDRQLVSGVGCVVVVDVLERGLDSIAVGQEIIDLLLAALQCHQVGLVTRQNFDAIVCRITRVVETINHRQNASIDLQSQGHQNITGIGIGNLQALATEF